MKIVDVTEFYSERGGGVRSHLTARGHHLCHLGEEHVVVAPGPTSGETKLSGCGGESQGGARVIRIAGPSLPYDPTYHLLARLDRVRAAIVRERPDVLEIHSPYLAMASSWLVDRSAARARTFFWHADFIDTYVRQLGSRHVPAGVLDGAIATLWGAVRRMLGTVDATFVASRTQEEKLRSHGVKNVLLVPFGVDRQLFAPSRRTTPFRAPGAPLKIVGVGRFAVEKRWDVVIEAVRCLKRPFRVTLFGDGPERARLEELARGLPVHFAGFEKDRAALATELANADLLVHGCPYETFGLGVAEAVSAGVPVIVPDEGGAFEGAPASSSESYRSLDARACAAAIERLLARDNNELFAAALANSRAILPAEAHFDRVVAHYRDLLQRNGRAASLDTSS